MALAHPYAFDPSHGFDLDALRAVRPPEPPHGFDAYWRDRHAAALTRDPRPRLADNAAQHPFWRTRDLLYASADGFEIGGWLLSPRDERVTRGLVVGHGYGGRDAPDFGWRLRETALLFPCFRGLSRSRRPQIPSDPHGHVLCGIHDRDASILGGCVEDLWLAVSALRAMFPDVGDRVGYAGASLGGGVGALAMAFDPRIARGHVLVPTFGAIPLWLRLPAVGSAQAAQQRQHAHGDALATLVWYDSAVAAARIAAPTLAAVARFDPAVAPPCQFAVANALTSNVHETVSLDAGHFDYPDAAEQHARLSEKVERFFEAL